MDIIVGISSLLSIVLIVVLLITNQKNSKISKVSKTITGLLFITIIGSNLYNFVALYHGFLRGWSKY